jgi:hypothetical protein
VLVLLVALVVKWPGAVLGEDQKAEERLPAKRAAVEQARQEFQQAEDAYKLHIRTYDVGGLLERLQGSALVATGVDNSHSAFREVIELSPEMLSYVDVLRRYAEAGEHYLDVLRLYDDDLMAWTRSLGAPSEGLRDDTFPIVEHLKLYPPPVGLKADPPLMTAAQVLTQSNQLWAARDALLAAPGPDPDTRSRYLDAIAASVDVIRASGRSIEHIESLHADYHRFLQTYDDAVGRVAASERGAGQPSFAAIAANVAVGLAVLVGLGLLFSARGKLSEA